MECRFVVCRYRIVYVKNYYIVESVVKLTFFVKVLVD